MNLLDQRLNMVLSLIPKGCVLLDVGTDHCKLPAAALLQGIAKETMASDLRAGPLAAARRQLAALGLADRIPLYQSNGLQAIPLSVLRRVNVAVVAGMGGEVIQSILQTAPVAPPCWVLQPMSAIYELLDYLAYSGWRIQKEGLARDQDRFYRAFVVIRDGEVHAPNYFGLLQNHPLYPSYRLKEQARIETALTGLKQARCPQQTRIAEQERLLHALRKDS